MKNFLKFFAVLILVPSVSFAQSGVIQYHNDTTNKNVAVSTGNPLPTNSMGSIASLVDNFNARPANTTAYTQGGQWNCNLAISGVTSASPPVLTVASNTLVAGQYVTIASVGGATSVNGTWKLGATTSTTLTLLNSDGTSPSAPSTYTSGGTVSQLLVFHVGRIANGTGYISKIEFNAKSTTVANGSFRIHFYNSPTVLALVDQSPWAVLASYFSYKIGFADMPLLQIEGTGGDSAFTQATNLNIPYVSDAQGNIYGVVVPEAAYVPTSGELLSIKIGVDQN